eukprot:gi/632943150/ref/XP_007886799.1/ PREDICTED: Fc receptor-like protein 5 [Callorhinchus milii]
MANILKIPVSGVTIKSSLNSSVLAEGSKLTLSCIVKEGTNVTYQWYFNNEKITEFSPSTQSDLVINKVNVNHSGKYYCEARNLFNLYTSSVTSNDTEIIVKVPVSNPSIEVRIVTAKPKIMAIIVCSSDQGTLPIIFTLYKNKSFVRNVTASSVRHVELIVQMTQNQGDIYKCKADNGFMPKYSNGLVIDLSVNLTSRHTVGQEVNLTCIVNYEFRGVYTWYFVTPSRNHTEISNTNYWNINPVEPGKYYCSVNGQLSKSFEIPSKGTKFQTAMIAISAILGVLGILLVICICYCIWRSCRE